ncbi:hypothetical protein ADL28_06600 [Streptomyces violaceusniger]|uniref:Uncharacterized protein n=1 Tax=Streptomyces violaceusniger TaxID=68280 RepID=A0A0X3X979_STRVO|nr:hypothetical protein ADL28_06600 [Streptomyces violaceusniger]
MADGGRPQRPRDGGLRAEPLSAVRWPRADFTGSARRSATERARPRARFGEAGSVWLWCEWGLAEVGSVWLWCEWGLAEVGSVRS